MSLEKFGSYGPLGKNALSDPTHYTEFYKHRHSGVQSILNTCHALFNKITTSTDATITPLFSQNSTPQNIFFAMTQDSITVWQFCCRAIISKVEQCLYVSSKCNYTAYQCLFLCFFRNCQVNLAPSMSRFYGPIRRSAKRGML